MLLNCDAIASVDLAEAVGTTSDNLAKHLNVLRDAGMLVQRIGRAYSLKSHFRVPGQNAINLGPIVMHLDYLQQR